MQPKNADRMANSVDPDRTALSGPVCPKTSGHYGIHENMYLQTFF